MIHPEKVSQIFLDQVVPLILTDLGSYQFSFSPETSSLHRLYKGIRQVIEIEPYASPISVDEDSGTVLFYSAFHFQVNDPEFEAFYFSHVEDQYPLPNEVLFTHKIRTRLEPDTLSPADFIAPAHQRQYAAEGNTMLIDHVPEIAYAHFTLRSSLFRDWMDALNAKTDPELVHEQLGARYPHTTALLLAYVGNPDPAKVYFQQQFERYQGLLENTEATFEERADDLIAYEKVRVLADRLLGVKYPDLSEAAPAYLVGNQATSLMLSSAHRYQEKLRITEFQVPPLLACVNLERDEIVLLLYSGEFHFLNEKGELQSTLAFPTEYHLLQQTPLTYIPSLDGYLFDHLLINAQKEIVVFPLPEETENGCPLTYLPQTNEFAIHLTGKTFNTVHFYSTEGSLIRELALPMDCTSAEIVPEKEWIVTNRGENNMTFFDFEGQIVGSYPVLNTRTGSFRSAYDLSQDHSFLLAYSYAAKSILHGLTGGPSSPLWACPPSNPAYAKLMENQEIHLFSMEMARFSPDTSYIVGTSLFHPRFVAWTLPELERAELRPQDSSPPPINIEREFKEAQTQMEASTLELIQDIRFMENGQFFATQLTNEEVLIWDRNFSHLQTLKNCEKFIPVGQDHLLLFQSGAIILLKKNEYFAENPSSKS